MFLPHQRLAQEILIIGLLIQAIGRMTASAVGNSSHAVAGFLVPESLTQGTSYPLSDKKKRALIKRGEEDAPSLISSMVQVLKQEGERKTLYGHLPTHPEARIPLCNPQLIAVQAFPNYNPRKPLNDDQLAGFSWSHFKYLELLFRVDIDIPGYIEPARLLKRRAWVTQREDGRYLDWSSDPLLQPISPEFLNRQELVMSGLPSFTAIERLVRENICKGLEKSRPGWYLLEVARGFPDTHFPFAFTYFGLRSNLRINAFQKYSMVTDSSKWTVELQQRQEGLNQNFPWQRAVPSRGPSRASRRMRGPKKSSMT